MLILGANSDDKGTQLENLTRAILETRRYQNVCRDWIGAGGDEIDVVGEFPAPMIGSGKLFKLICECKAYKAAVTLPDWLKFCGKVYIARQTSNPDTHGCFIALSGVNGNVRGSYDQLRAHNGNIELITGDDLLAAVRTVYPHHDRRVVLGRVKALTDRVVTESDLAYRGGQVYWLVLFENAAYTVLTASGSSLSQEEASVLRPIIEAAQAVATYVDLQQESVARAGLVKLKAP